MDFSFLKPVLEILSALWDFIKKLLPSKKKENIYYDIPKRTIIVAPNPNKRSTWWHMGSEGGKPAMQVVGRFHVTNITKYKVILAAVKMKKPRHLGSVTVKDSESNYHGRYQIPPGGFTDMSFDFWINPPFKKEGESFTADIAVLDQFGNEHWIKNVHFIYT